MWTIEKKREYHRNWYLKNKDRIDAYRSGYRIAHPEIYKVAAKRTRTKTRYQALFHYSDGTLQCACCHLNIFSQLELDHVNGDGAEHRKNVSSAARLDWWLKKNNYPPGFQVLCKGCNASKGNGEKCLMVHHCQKCGSMV